MLYTWFQLCARSVVSVLWPVSCSIYTGRNGERLDVKGCIPTGDQLAMVRGHLWHCSCN
jgi:hypothetical protein